MSSVSDTVTIPADTARSIAEELRATARMHVRGEPGHSELLAHADLLDPPPPPSLRDDAAVEIARWMDTDEGEDVAVDAVLAVVRQHVEALDVAAAVDGDWLHRAEVLRLLNGGAE